MTIPSTGPLPVRELVVRRDRRPDVLLVASALLTALTLVLIVSSAAVDELHGGRLVTCLVLLAVDYGLGICAVWLIRPRMLPPIEMTTSETPTRRSRSPERRGSWPWGYESGPESPTPPKPPTSNGPGA